MFCVLIRLQEPKKDLIARVVRILGNKKAIELLMETAEVEQNGGLFIMVRLFLLFLLLYYHLAFFFFLKQNELASLCPVPLCHSPKYIPLLMTGFIHCVHGSSYPQTWDTSSVLGLQACVIMPLTGLILRQLSRRN